MGMTRYQPYAMALGRQDEIMDSLNRISKAGEATASRTGKIRDLKGQLHGEQLSKYKKIEESVKESQRKARKGSGFRKLLKVAGMFMGPLGAGLTSGIAGYMGAERQKGALKHLAKALGKHGEFSAAMKGKGRGLSWLSNPMSNFTENVMSGKRDVEKSASKINALKAGLTSGLTSALTAKISGKEGMFGGGKLKAIAAGDVALKDALAKQFIPGFDSTAGAELAANRALAASEPAAFAAKGLTVADDLMVNPQTFAQFAKSAEGAKALTGLLPQLTGAFEDEAFELPDFGRPIY
mgnify:CR=1